MASRSQNPGPPERDIIAGALRSHGEGGDEVDANHTGERGSGLGPQRALGLQASLLPLSLAGPLASQVFCSDRAKGRKDAA